MYNPNYQSWGPQGWRCPGCGRYYAPNQPMCFYCGGNQRTWTSPMTTSPSTDDSQWWEEYLKKSTTGKRAFDNPSTTVATTNIDPNVKITSWNNMETGHVEIGKDGSIMWKGAGPEVHYPSTIQEWFEVFNNGE